MSIYWDRKSYGGFRNKRMFHGKLTAREKLVWHWYPCPGCLSHSQVIGVRRADILFSAYQKRSNKSYLVYWRSHPAEWQKLQETVRQERNPS